MREEVVVQGDGVTSAGLCSPASWPPRQPVACFLGKGIATELCRLAVQWAHGHANIIRATVLESNARSRRVVERAGFEREGLLRSYPLL